MKLYKCAPAQADADRQWEMQVAEDGGDFKRIQELSFYATQEECEADILCFDTNENGST